ncbi:hypothetical protein CJ260_01630 [Megasphaera sp. ASD88]|uniref:restriction endonuclease subunit S n=1 Tax=Megasphaera sp. ASD88 TaxID=2027407 RepID=UPI000BABDE05|nr:restriction endonuclease subunit S [Megasphaera sp. ASD88]PAV40163.1 hypothetical protein CJ260_01630 [Megasphaera sp. ASD88]
MKVTLGSVASYINGFAFKPTDWSTCGLKIIRIQNLTNPTSEANYYSGTYDLKYEVNRGDVLISWSASLGIYIWQDEKAVLNQHIFKVVFDKVSLNKKYFFYQVSYILKRAESETHGATMKHLTRPVFNALPFELPSMEQQNFIANELDIIARLINAHKRQLHLLDELVKSRFVEMFGDPVRNEKKWIKGNMQSICIRITDGEHGSVPRSEIGHPFLNAKHIKPDGAIDWKTTTFVANEVHEKIYRRCNPETGDILVTTTGTIGNVAIVPDTEPFSMDRGITLLKLQKEKISSIFIAWLLKFDSIQEIMNANIHASAIGHLFLNKVKQLPVIIPPLELQNEFSSFVIQVDKSRLLFKCQLLQYHSIEDIIRGRNYG